MDTIFMNSENSKTYNPYKLLFNLIICNLVSYYSNLLST